MDTTAGLCLTITLDSDSLPAPRSDNCRTTRKCISQHHNVDDRTGRANHIDQTGHREHYELPPKSLRLTGTETEATITMTGIKTLYHQADMLLTQETSGMTVLGIINQVARVIAR